MHIALKNGNWSIQSYFEYIIVELLQQEGKETIKETLTYYIVIKHVISNKYRWRQQYWYSVQYCFKWSIVWLSSTALSSSIKLFCNTIWWNEREIKYMKNSRTTDHMILKRMNKRKEHSSLWLKPSFLRSNFQIELSPIINQDSQHKIDNSYPLQ